MKWAKNGCSIAMIQTVLICSTDCLDTMITTVQILYATCTFPNSRWIECLVSVLLSLFQVVSNSVIWRIFTWFWQMVCRNFWAIIKSAAWSSMFGMVTGIGLQPNMVGIALNARAIDLMWRRTIAAMAPRMNASQIMRENYCLVNVVKVLIFFHTEPFDLWTTIFLNLKQWKRPCTVCLTHQHCKGKELLKKIAVTMMQAKLNLNNHRIMSTSPTLILFDVSLTWYTNLVCSSGIMNWMSMIPFASSPIFSFLMVSWTLSIIIKYSIGKGEMSLINFMRAMCIDRRTLRENW